MQPLLVETKDGIRTLTLNRPERLNAVNTELHLQLEHALREASRDDEVRIIVMTGSGRGFCAGLDLADRQTKDPSTRTRHEQLDEWGWVGRLTMAIVECDKPIIAAINGIAAGAGFALTLSCDIRFLSASARLTTGYIRRGLSPDAGVSYFLPRLIGLARASDLIYSGRDITPEEAERIGLVNQVFAPEEFHERVVAYAKELASGPPIAMTYSKRLLAASYDSNLPSLLKQEFAYIKHCFRTQDAAEGVRAFIEKRPPLFRGE